MCSAGGGGVSKKAADSSEVLLSTLTGTFPTKQSAKEYLPSPLEAPQPSPRSSLPTVTLFRRSLLSGSHLPTFPPLVSPTNHPLATQSLTASGLSTRPSDRRTRLSSYRIDTSRQREKGQKTIIVLLP